MAPSIASRYWRPRSCPRNLGKRDNFYAREIINLVNRYVKAKIEIGRIDLTTNCSFFEVPEADARLVMQKMSKAKVGDRRVIVDDADREARGTGRRKPEKLEAATDGRGMKSAWKAERKNKAGRGNGRKGRNEEKKSAYKEGDWRQFFEK